MSTYRPRARQSECAFNLANGAGANGNPAAGAFWPDVAGETFYRPLIQGMQRTVLPIMRSILTFLGEEASSFDDKLTDSNFGFRLNYYPPLSDQAQQSGTGRMLGQSGPPAARPSGVPLRG